MVLSSLGTNIQSFINQISVKFDKNLVYEKVWPGFVTALKAGAEPEGRGLIGHPS